MRRKGKIGEVLFTILVIVGCIGLSEIVIQYSDGRVDYDEARELREIKAIKEISRPILDDTAENGLIPIELNVNEAELKKTNEDYQAWLYIPGTKVDYPVVSGDSGGYYLNHTFSRRKNSAGAIFTDPGCSLFQSENTIIYGHNMKDRSMFGSLKNYLKEDYLENHDEVWISQNGKLYRFRVFSIIETDTGESEAYTYSFASKEDKKSFIAKMTEESVIKTKYIPKETDWMITLSTCTGKAGRLLILAAISK